MQAPDRQFAGAPAQGIATDSSAAWDDAAGLPQTHLWDYVQVVLQRLPLALSVLVVGIVLAAVYTWTRPERYTATARILVQPGSVNLTELKGVFDPTLGVSPRDFVQTQVQLMTSKPVIASVLEKANLISDPEYSRSADPVRKLTRQIGILPLRNTYLIDVSIEREDAHQAQRIVNSLIDAFLAESRTRRLGISEDGLQELQSKAEDLRAKLDAASREVREFLIQNRTVSLEKTESVIVERMRDLSRQLTAAEPARMALQAQVEAADAAIAAGRTVDSLPAVLNSPVVKELKLDMARLEGEYSNLLQRLGENHPQLQTIAVRVDSLRTKIGIEAAGILASLRTEFEQARKEESLLREAIAQHETEVFRFNELAARYNVLKQKQESVESAHNTLIRRIEEIDISRIGDQGNNIFVIARAAPPTEPSWPSKGRNMVVAFILSVGAAIGLCFFLDYMDTTIRNEADIRQVLGASVLAAIPNAGAEADGRLQADLVIQESPKSHSAEAFRALRTALAFSRPGELLHSVVVTSTFPEEGKSLVSINLAIAQAQVGRRTLLVDSDMRKPRLHRALSISAKRGLANLLAGGDASLDELVIATSFENLFFLPCGPIPPNPVELLDSPAFGRLMEEIGARFDFAILDSPPSFNLVDSTIMARRADGLILVVRSFVTPKRPVEQIASRFRDAQVPLLGVALNNVDVPKGGYYYGAYYYYGRHRYYYYTEHPDDQARGTKRGRRREAAAAGQETARV